MAASVPRFVVFVAAGRHPSSPSDLLSGSAPLPRRSSPRVALHTALGEAFRSSYYRAFDALGDVDEVPASIATSRLQEVLLWLVERGFHFRPPVPASLGQQVRRLLSTDPSADWSMQRVPLGAALLLEVDGTLLAESGAIVEFILARYGRGRLRHGPDHPDFAAYLYWFHFANGNLQPAMFRSMTVARCGVAPDHPLRRSVDERLDRVLALMDARLAQSAHLAGDDFTAADIMSVFSLTTMRLFHPVDLAPWPNLRAYLQGIGARPAYRRAMAKGDPDLTPLLT